MLLKIISGGQTGVDRAALDAAIKMDIAHGGWIPKGRLTEDGQLPESYALKETDSSEYARRTAKNVEDADATLIISQGPLSGGSALTLRLAKEIERPWLHIDLEQQPAFQAAVTISKWIVRHQLEILNVAGPRASKDPQIYSKTVRLLETVFYLELVHSSHQLPDGAAPKDQAGNGLPSMPVTVPQAADCMIQEMALKDRVTLANMAEIELPSLGTTLGKYVLNRFELEGQNARLLEASRWDAGSMDLTANDATTVIIRAAWKKLQKTHKLRVIKNPSQN